MHCFKIILVFVTLDYGVMSISNAKKPTRPEVASPVDRATMVSYIRVPATFSVYLEPFDGTRGFLLAEGGGMSSAVAGGHAGSRITSSFDSLTPILYRLAVGIFRLFLIQKLFDFFRLPLKMLSVNSRDCIIPQKKYFQ
jgi:hypothetical protein